MSAAVDLVPMTPRHLVPPDLHRVEALLVQMSADIGRLAAKVETLGDGQKDLREEFRAEVRLLRADLSSLCQLRRQPRVGPQGRRGSARGRRAGPVVG